MRSPADELSHRHRPEPPLEPLLHEAREDQYPVAPLDQPLTERELGSEELAPEGRGDLPSDRSTPLPVGPLHLGDVEGGIAALHGESEEEMLQHQVVEDDDSGMPERRVQRVSMVRAVPDLIEVQVEPLPRRDVLVVAGPVPGECDSRISGFEGSRSETNR